MSLVPYIIDVETGIHNRGEDAIGSMKASPFHPDNHIVWSGSIDGDKEGMIVHGAFSPSQLSINMKGFPIRVMVGHNIKFDLLYLMKDVPNFREDIWPTLKIWDTMLAEYMLSGQVKKYPSLDTISPKYGGTLKDDRLKDLWNNDVDTEDIPKDIIVPYLQQDLINAGKAYRGQVKKAKELGMYKLIVAQMNGLKATTEMEWNGMAFNKKGADELAAHLRSTVDDLIDDLTATMTGWFGHGYKPNPMSPKDVATLLYGGGFNMSVKEPIIEKGQPARFKTGPRKGKVKTRRVTKTFSILGFQIEKKAEYTTKKGNMASNEKVMSTILMKEKLTPEQTAWLNLLLAVRGMQKDVTTYYEGYSKMVWPDGRIHPSYNHVSTDTGRLSCSNPNLQNVSRKGE
jgi:DNA polymerase I-like protein with 3'-5' exonuclease and polymerase domains